MLIRHGRTARVLHAANAAVVIVLLVTGLALGDVVSARVAGWLGGHERINAAHQWLGLAFAVAMVLLAAALPRRVARLLRDSSRFRRGDGRWIRAFLAYLVAPRLRAPPFHDGRFDPAQRLVFLGILVGIAGVTASGVYLYAWTPAFALGQMSLAYAIRVHIVAAWLLIACLALHIAAGSGLPWTHRGLVRAMFGHGRVPISLARRLWPGWARRQAETEGRQDDLPSGPASPRR